MKSLRDHLVALAAKDPQKTALLVLEESGVVTEEISRAALLERVTAAAGHLLGLGLHKGDRVALELENCAELLMVSWAAWSMGIITVPLDTKRDTKELREFKLRTTGAKKVIQNEPWLTNDQPIEWASDLTHEALILFTSGTTAYPKGARLTLHNLVVNAQSIIEWLQIIEDDRFLVQLPLHHINSTTFSLAALLAGAAIAIPPRYSNSRFWEQAVKSGATFTSVVPSIIFDQLGRADSFSAARNRLKLNRIQVGSAPVIASDALLFMKQFSIPLYQGYGQTETALRVTGVPMDLSPDLYHTLVSGNSIGAPLSWATLEIASDGGRILGEGEEGELIVKGAAVMQGYVGEEPAFRDGYFLTGDIGYFKEIGGRQFFFLKGRSKEIVIKGGVNISPVAIENILKTVSSDIDQAYVVGVDDKRYGEEVGAAIVWKESADIVQTMRRLKLTLLLGHPLLSAYETPKHLATVRADELPTTSTGKVQRMLVRKNASPLMESVYSLLQSAEFNFTVIGLQSPFAEASRTLYNHCWQPLIKNEKEYKHYLGEYLTLGAFVGDALHGQISFSYSNNVFTCVSICSAHFKPKSVPVVNITPSVEFVRDYLLAGHDPVMNFHAKLGARLMEVIPNGRPEDASSLGYTMLLAYPPLEATTLEGSVSNQLIQAVRLLGNDVRATVTALSRPGGLAAYMSRQV